MKRALPLDSEEDLDGAGAEEMVHLCRGSRPGRRGACAGPVAPGALKLGGGEEDPGGVGEGAAEEHGGGAAVDERDLAVRGRRGWRSRRPGRRRSGSGVSGAMAWVRSRCWISEAKLLRLRAGGRSGRRRCGPRRGRLRR